MKYHLQTHEQSITEYILQIMLKDNNNSSTIGPPHNTQCRGTRKSDLIA